MRILHILSSVIALVVFSGTCIASTWFPIERDHGRVLAPVFIEGVALNAIIDTGASISVIDKQVADTWRIGSTGKVRVAGNFKSKTLPLTDELALEFANLPAAESRLAIASFDQRDRRAQLILGLDVLANLRFEIDFLNNRMRVLEAQTLSPSGYESYGLVRRQKRYSLVLPTALSDDESLHFLLDTGNVSFTQVNARGLDLLAGEYHAEAPVAVRGLFGQRELARHRFSKLQLGSFALYDVPALLMPFENRLFDGNMGIDVLGYFSVIFDFPRAKLYLRSDLFES